MIDSDKPVRYRSTLAYDGTSYHGFQRQQAGIATVQSVVETAIKQVTQQQVTILGAGRTDAGVHATGQVIAFDVAWKHNDHDLLRAINACLPDDIALQDICQQSGFHPRYDAQSRTYCYHVIQAMQPQPLLRNRTWRVHQHLDIDTMQEASQLFIGEHDFASFGQPPQGDNTVREVFEADWSVEAQIFGHFLIFKIRATAYLYHMVRRIVGTLVQVGRGVLTIDELQTIMRSRDMSQVRLIAPPQGLILAHVAY